MSYIGKYWRSRRELKVTLGFTEHCVDLQLFECARVNVIACRVRALPIRRVELELASFPRHGILLGRPDATVLSLMRIANGHKTAKVDSRRVPTDDRVSVRVICALVSLS